MLAFKILLISILHFSDLYKGQLDQLTNLASSSLPRQSQWQERLIGHSDGHAAIVVPPFGYERTGNIIPRQQQRPDHWGGKTSSNPRNRSEIGAALFETAATH